MNSRLQVLSPVVPLCMITPLYDYPRGQSSFITNFRKTELACAGDAGPDLTQHEAIIVTPSAGEQYRRGQRYQANAPVPATVWLLVTAAPR